jgi:Na+/melibiose symporter-like transporter
MSEIIPTPGNLSPIPDSATKTGMSDFTGDSADNRVLKINLYFIKYGTSDQAHAASLVFSAVLLLSIIVLFIFAPSGEQLDKLLGWLEGGFLLTLGVAIGKSGKGAS